MLIKLLGYNILHGFHSLKAPFILENKRIEAAKEVVRQINPDILVLTEACFTNNNGFNMNMNYGRIFDYPYYAISNHAKEWGSAVLSRYPIINASDFSMDKRGFLRSSLDLGHKLVNVDVVHPHPELLEIEKAKFMKACLRDFKTPYILTGDFNACSRQDNYNIERLVEGFRKFHPEPDKKVSDLMQRLTIDEVIRHGLVDSFIAAKSDFDFTIPTDFLSKDKASGIRIDYIFCSEDFKVIDADIIKNKYSEGASDHYPVFALLNI